MNTVLVLDAQGVIESHYQVEEVPTDLKLLESSQGGEGSFVCIEGECDLEPGKYRWDAEERTAVPLHLVPYTVERRVEEKKALWWGFTALQESGLVDLPVETKEWLTWFPSTLDGIGLPKK